MSSSSSSSSSSSVATVNFGGINTSNIEFVNYSNPQLKQYSLMMLELFNAFGEQTLTINEFLKKHLNDHDDIEFIRVLLDNASLFAKQAFDMEKISPTVSFDTMTMGDFFSNYLCRDKGIGGFEQPLTNRPCNLSKKLSEFVQHQYPGGDNTINQLYFIEELHNYYSNSIPELTSLDNASNYSDIFMKGRKEADDGKSTMNYYKESLVRTNELDTLFHSMAKLVLIVYDLITLEIMCGFENGKIPLEMCHESDEIVVNGSKAHMLETMFQEQLLDILFVTEAVPGVFDELFEHTTNIIIWEGEVLGGLCNTIIYRVGFDSPIKCELEEYELVDYEHPDEYKELPLILSDSNRLITLVCFHANGKGITINGDIVDSSFKQLLDSLPGKVIVGCDLNIDYKKVGEELDASFDVGHLEKGGFTCYKQRGPVQPQFDKTGVVDTKHCDFIITKNITRVGDGMQRVVKCRNDGSIKEVSGEHGFSKEQLIIPNDDFPFEHYIVIDTFDIDSDKSNVVIRSLKYIFGGVTYFLNNLTHYYLDDMMPGYTYKE